MLDNNLIQSTSSWPFVEIRKLLKDRKNIIKKKGLITFSDDMDGLRKVPDNIPNDQVLKDNLGKPLTDIPDPFKKYNSFGEHNNEMLKKFLNEFNFKFI